jgi:acetylornithine aminotransferase
VIADGLKAALVGVAGVVEVRGQGLMLGLELNRSCGEIVEMALQDGLLTNVTQDSVIRILPPLIINESEAREIVKRLSAVVKRLLAKPSGISVEAA